MKMIKHTLHTAIFKLMDLSLYRIDYIDNVALVKCQKWQMSIGGHHAIFRLDRQTTHDYTN